MLSMWRIKPGRERSRNISLESLYGKGVYHTSEMLRLRLLATPPQHGSGFITALTQRQRAGCFDCAQHDVLIRVI